MLENNNKPIINKLVKNTIRTNRQQFAILFVTVMLSAFMLFSIFTVGLTYMDLSRLQNTRLYGSEHDVAIINGFTEAQKEIAEKNSKVQSVGMQAYSGYVRGTDADDTVDAALLWCDEIFWEIQKAPARTEMNGSYPQAENELLATKEVLEACGVGTLSVGDCFTMTYEDNTGIHEKEFVISGIWSGYGGDRRNFYVSKAFYDQSGFDLEVDGILQIKFKRDYVTGGTIENLRESLALSRRQIFQASDYIERSLTILLAVCGLCLVICLSAYLLIYNILYLSVSGKIRYYGLLQALGMTKRQLVRFIKKQVLSIGITGTATGVLLGMLVTLFFVPYIMEMLGISLGNEGLCFYPAVLIISVLTTGIAIVCGVRTPIRIATGVTPVEATKYRINLDIVHENKRLSGNDKGVRKGNLYCRMAKNQLGKDKKKTFVVFCSLATSLMVFYCLATIIDSQGKRTVYPNYRDADFIVRNDTQTAEDATSLQSAIGETLVSDMEETDGVSKVHAVRGIPVTFPYDDGFADFWIRGYSEIKPYLSYDEVRLDYQKNPEKYYGMVKGIAEDEFDDLNELLGNAVDKELFLNGEIAILQYAGFEIPKEWVGRAVSFTAENRENSDAADGSNQTCEITIGAVSYESYYASANVGATLIVSESYLKSLSEEPYILSVTVKYGQSYREDTENAMKNLLEQSPCREDLSYTSKYDEMKTIQDSQGGMFEIGTVIALLLLLVGMLNYVNTMASGMQNRKLTFSVMESVGMSRRQMKKMLVREGILYAVGSIFITLTVGTGVTYLVFQSMNYMGIAFVVPVFPIVCAIVLVMGICVVTSVITYEKMTGKRPLVERLREYE